MTASNISLSDDGIRIADLEVQRKDVADFLRGVREEQRAAIVIQAIEVGIYCLERTRTNRDTEFVRRQVESLLSRVAEAVETIPDVTQKALLKKLGTGEGEVLAPLQALVHDVSLLANERVKEVKDLLAEEIDPARESSTLGKALRTLRDLLDPERVDSVQHSFEAAIKRVTTADGALPRAVRTVVAEAVKPLAQEVDKLTREIRGKGTADSLVRSFPESGSYDEAVVMELQDWAQVVGAEIHHVGPDNRPGDIVVRFAANSLAQTPVSIVLVVRDDQTGAGRQAIAETLAAAIAERQADASIYLSRTLQGLDPEVGDWAEGECDSGKFIACAHPNLTTALRFLIVQQRLSTLRQITPRVPTGSLEIHLQRVRGALERVKLIKRKVADIRSCGNEIQAEAETLRNEIRGALSRLEDTIRPVLEKRPLSEAA